MNLDKDIELVNLCQSGDLSAFDGLVRRHQDRIYRLVYKILDGSNECDDIAQEAFLKAYRSIKKFNCQSSFSTWLTRIAINQCISHLKRRRRLRILSFGLFSEHHQTEPQILVERNEKREIVCKAINSLPLKQRVVIIMYYFESYGCKEMSEILKCSVGTVKSRLFYARMSLKNKLEPNLKDDELFENGNGVST